jgi:hypothetical protein
MHNLYHKLSLKDIIFSPAISGKGNIIGLNIINSLITNIICRVYISSVNLIFLEGDYPIILTIKRLPLRKTKFWQFSTIYKDKGLITGTYQIYNNIFLA